MNDGAFRSAMDWIDAEHKVYQSAKWSHDHDDDRTRDEPEVWATRIEMYLHRATVLGVENPLGRQAAAKAAATAVGFLESLLRVYGSIPAPGFTSGEQRGEFTYRGGNDE